MTCWRRLAEWHQAGVWQHLHEVLLAELHAADRLDWSKAVIDGSHLRAMKVPGDLVRRDVETQFLLRRETLAGVDLTEFPVVARIEASRFEITPFDSIVAIVSKRTKNFERFRDGLEQLRKAGLAE
jgi:hypothetical protein